ncbi:type II secretion system protein [Thermaurantiacus sp.]
MGTRPTSAASRRGGREAGFTLVEVLVALVLLALVGITLAEFQTMQASGTVRLQRLSLARIEADNRAIAWLLAAAAPTGPVRGETVNGGLPFRWEVTPGPSPDPEAFPELVTVTIAVRAEADGPVLAQREILRPRG